MLAAGQDPAEQDRRVNRGNLRIPQPFACIHVGPMEVESAVVLHCFPQETKCVDNAAARFGVGNVAALVADA